MTKAAIIDFSVEEVAEYFDYLDELRDSGATNMFGAGAYLQIEFALSRSDARAILSAWMDTFDSEMTPDERAADALLGAA